MNAEELLRRYAAGERNFAGVDLSSVDLREAELTRINLVGANLRGVNLTGANLNCSALRKADLRNANLKGTDLSGANLILLCQMEVLWSVPDMVDTSGVNWVWENKLRKPNNKNNGSKFS
ncbi:MAG: pentapeptide repeat-containing protein [Nostoc sp.]|uniref:pentapeptide repeat-containing protein n=1 Tax=Nostoc sp. TaxID=1180 RepID=UPI002FF5588B